MLKRRFDLLIAIIIGLVCLPLASRIASGVAPDLAGPVIISTRRLGRAGRPFDQYRFRTMAG